MSSLLSRMSRRTSSRLLKNTFTASLQRTTVLSQSHLSSATAPPPVLNDIDHDDMTIDITTNFKPKAPYDQLRFGKEFTDHLLEIDWDNTNGWHAPRIIPYGPFAMDPASSVLHYALEAFEGMKAYIDDSNNIRLFRPKHNVWRMLDSCEALFFPQFDANEFMECLYDLIRLEKSWIPKKDGYSLYIRPTIISTYPFIGVAPAENVKLFVILSPVGPYYPEGFKAVSLLADNRYVRAWPKGTGDKKLGGNYGPTIKAQRHANARGYSQVMWLFGEDDPVVTEVGTMNQFFFWVNEAGERELITAPLDGTILPGVTRSSILQLCREMDQFEVTERHFTIGEIIKAADENRIIEAFGAGTAAIVSPVKLIGYHGRDYEIPLDPDNPEEQAGPLARLMYKKMTDIQYGRVPHKWSVLVPDKEITQTKQ